MLSIEEINKLEQENEMIAKQYNSLLKQYNSLMAYTKELEAKFFIGLILIVILSLLALPIFSKTVYEYNKYGTKTGYYVQNGNVYDKYGKFVKQYR